MNIQLIRNATMKIAYGNRVFVTDPYFAPKHSQAPLIGKSPNPLVDLPIPPEDIIADVEMAIISHLHPDHFDDQAQKHLPGYIQIYCQPGDENQIKKAGFSNVVPVIESVVWHGVEITRISGRHGDEVWAPKMGPVAGFILRSDNEPTVYWTGDTIWCETLRQVLLDVKPDIIITHSSGAGFEIGHPIIMDGQQTMEVCRAAGQSTVIAVHMETFDFDTVSRPNLRAMADAAGIDAARLLIPLDGESFEFTKKE